MKKTVLLQFCTLIILTVMFGCNQVPDHSKTLNSVTRQDSIENDEKNFPVAHHYLIFKNRAVIRPIYVETIENVKSKHQGYVLSMELFNNALTTSYKDINIEITYFSKDKTVLNNEIISVNQLIKPGTTFKVSKKVLRYKNTNYKVKILSAIPVV